MNDPRAQVVEAISRAQDELQQALADLDRLSPLDPDRVAFAAHALSNFLTLTGGTVDLIRERLSDHPDRQVARWLDGLVQATGMMTHTVSQLMNASSTSTMSLRFDCIELPVLVERVCDFYRRVARAKGIDIVFESAANVPEVWADRVALAAVMDNLMSNAIKYSPHGKRVFVRVMDEPDAAVCSVRDEGPGLRADERSQLFQRGARLSPQPTGGESAAGYGLAVARELMDRLGGRIWHEDAPETGSIFSIRVPAHSDDPPAW